MPQRIALLLSFLCLWLPASAGFAGEDRCHGQPEVAVEAAGTETLGEICRAATKAIVFLGQYGLHPQRSIVLEVVEEKIDYQGHAAYGRYESDRDRIQLMSYAAILTHSAQPTMLGEAFDRVHYVGLIAHEVAHAVVDHNLVVKKFATISQEYLAYATQLAVLPAERREAIIRTMGVAAWAEGDVISPEYMAMSPSNFAVKSYRHLTSLENPAEFVGVLLNSKWLYVYVPEGLHSQGGKGDEAGRGDAHKSIFLIP